MSKANLVLISVLVIGGLVVGMGLSSFQARAADSELVQNELAADGSSPQADASPDAVCTIDATGALAYWPLNENSGATTFEDVTANTHDGSCTGSKCPTSTTGILNGAFTFNASQEDVISVPSDAEFDSMAAGNFSVAVWVKTTQDCALGHQQNIVFIGRYRTISSASEGSWWVGCTGSGVAVFRLRDSNNVVRQIDGVSRVNDGLWHYIVGVRNASGGNQNLLYVDGKLEGTLTSPAYTGVFDSADPITMGAYDVPQNYFLQGALDEVVLFDRALTPTEIANQNSACSPTLSNYLPIISK